MVGVGNKMSYVAFADLSEEFVYGMMKILFDDVEMDAPGRFTRYHPSSGAFTLRLAPVSYTHLDVYKRQTPICANMTASI